MAITLDPATEERIQRELERGPYREPEEVLAVRLHFAFERFLAK